MVSEAVHGHPMYWQKKEMINLVLSVAFLEPINGSNYGDDAVKALKATCDNIDKVYELDNPQRKEFNASFTGVGSISELINFVKE